VAEEEKSSILQPLGVTLLVLALLLGFAWLPRLFRGFDHGMVDKPAPDFDLPVLSQGAVMKTSPQGDAKRFALKDLRGKAVVLDFWATWCGPCQAELPIIDGVARRMANKDVVIIGVNQDDQQEAADQWIADRRTPMAFPMIYDDTNVGSRMFDVHNLPTLVVVSKTGKIVGFRVGVTEAAELERLIEKALL
jgi:cytochrome c biogenesis protein CcmG/thiol:disulfide interchange protein DsbE